jgi:hypothetical protein
MGPCDAAAQCLMAQRPGLVAQGPPPSAAVIPPSRRPVFAVPAFLALLWRSRARRCILCVVDWTPKAWGVALCSDRALRMIRIPIAGLLGAVWLAAGLAGLAASASAASLTRAAWVEVGDASASAGGISDNATASEYARVALDVAGRPVLAWHDRALRDVLVAGWNGSAWCRFGAGTGSPGGADELLSCYPSLALLEGMPVVAWVQEQALLSFAVYVRRWDGTAWQEVGVGSASGGGVSQTTGWALYPALAALPGAQLVVAWQENSSADDEICVRRWTGSAWAEMGAGSATGNGISHSVGRAEYPAVAAAANGRVAVAWIDSAPGAREVYLRCWDGTGWAELGGHSASGNGVSDSHGGISGQEPPALAVGPDGRITVAWADAASGNAEIYVRCWDGSAWLPLGEGSASGGGVSRTAGPSTRPALALSATGRPVLAWQEQVDGTAQILVRYWDGVFWTAAGDGGSGHGVSQTAGASRRPAIALDAAAGRTFVAWDSDVGGGNTEVYVRQWDASGVDAEPSMLWSLTVTGANTQRLDFGFAGAAAVGLDGSDQESSSGPGLAWFEIPGATLSSDVRPFADSAEWHLVVAAGPVALTLAWPSLSTGDSGRFLSLYEVDARGVPLGNSAHDLALAGTWTVPAGERHTYVLRVGQDLVIDLALQSGWNAFSLPIEPVDGSVAALSPVIPAPEARAGGDRPAAAALGHGVAWALGTEGWQAVTELHALTGYWLYAPTAGVLLLHGLPVTAPAWPVHAGWNCVGPPADMALPANPVLAAPAWEWDPLARAYRVAPHLLRTGAFWVYATSAATLSLDGGRSAP